MPEIQIPFIGSVSIVVLALPLLYGPLAIWVILRMAGVLGRPKEETRLRGRAQRTLLFWACPECHSVTPEPADVCYYCGARRLSDEQPPVSAVPAAPPPAQAAAPLTTSPGPRVAPAARTAQRIEPVLDSPRPRRPAATRRARGTVQRPGKVPVLRVVTPEAESAEAIAAAADIMAAARDQGTVRSGRGRRRRADDGLEAQEVEEPTQPGRRVAG